MLEAVVFDAALYGKEIAGILERAGSGVRPAPLVRTGSASPELGKAISDLRTSEAVKSGLYLYCGCWDEAHSAADRVENPDGYFWHGIVHRQEPDPGNAAYWFRRAGVHPVFARLGEDAGACGYKIEPATLKARAQVLAAEARLDGWVRPFLGAASGGPCAAGHAWDPFAFIEYCESARRRPGSKEEQVAMKVQLIEWQLLFDYCARGSRG
jgi:hypothetical protein